MEKTGLLETQLTTHYPKKKKNHISNTKAQSAVRCRGAKPPAIKHTSQGSLPSSTATGSTQHQCLPQDEQGRSREQLGPGSQLCFWGTNPSYADSTIHTALINIPVGMLLTLLTVANQRAMVSEIIPIKL